MEESGTRIVVLGYDTSAKEEARLRKKIIKIKTEGM